jgi:hypothetical protein
MILKRATSTDLQVLFEVLFDKKTPPTGMNTETGA